MCAGEDTKESFCPALVLFAATHPHLLVLLERSDKTSPWVSANARALAATPAPEGQPANTLPQTRSSVTARTRRPTRRPSTNMAPSSSRRPRATTALPS